MKYVKLTKHHVNMAKKKSRWDLGNKILYDMCANYPYHKSIDQIVAKTWLIGRSYAAAIERRKNAKEYNEDFYTEVVGPVMMKSGIDQWIAEINRFRFPTLDNIENILAVHGSLMNLMNLPAASCGVSKWNSPKLTRLSILRSRATAEDRRYSSFGAFAPPSSVGTELLAKADHPCSPASGIFALLRQAAGYSGEGE